MSRLSTLSPAALKAMFSSESQDTLITLVTIYDPVTNLPSVRLADNYLTRISETGDDIVYGVTSRSQNFIFVPIQVTLPDEEDNTAPKCSLVITDVTRYVTPIIRELSGPPRVMIELVLTSSPNTVEVYFSDFYISNISYNADSVTAELAMIDFQLEPFPAYSFTPAYFPGIF